MALEENQRRFGNRVTGGGTGNLILGPHIPGYANLSNKARGASFLSTFLINTGSQVEVTDARITVAEDGTITMSDRVPQAQYEGGHEKLTDLTPLDVPDNTPIYWYPPQAGGDNVARHSELLGLNADDHPQYLKKTDVTPQHTWLNIIPDSGRFMAANQLNIEKSSPDSFDLKGSHITATPGDTFSDGGKFVNRSTTYSGGGTRPAVPVIVQNLLKAMGRVSQNHRPGTWSQGGGFGQDFHILKVDTTTRGKIAAVKFPLAAGVDGFVSGAYWIYVHTGQLTLSKTYWDDLWVDGVKQTGRGSVSIQQANGWKHIAAVKNLSVGTTSFNVPFLNVLVPRSVIYMALPVLVQGRVQIPMHKAPAPAVMGALQTAPGPQNLKEPSGHEGAGTAWKTLIEVTASGKTITVNDIPETANEIMIDLDDVPVPANMNVKVQLGTAAAFDANGYSGLAARQGTMESTMAYARNSFVLSGAEAGNRFYTATMTKIGTNRWALSGSGFRNSIFPDPAFSNQRKTLGDVLTRLRIFLSGPSSVTPTGKFTGGTITVLWR